MPKISIIIPIYNAEKFIEQCAHSLFAQTMDELEFIFIDDCTPDDSITIIENVLTYYPHRISQTRIVRMAENSGIAAVRRYGISLATGEYVMFCDSDDWVDIHICDELYSKASIHNSDVVFCDFYRSTDTDQNYVKRELNNIQDIFSLQKYIIKNQYWTVWAIIIKRSIYLRNEIIYPSYNNAEDAILICQILFYIKSFAYVNKGLYFYRYNPKSISCKMDINSIEFRVNEQKGNIMLLEQFYKKQDCLKLEIYKKILTALKLNCISHYFPISNNTIYVNKARNLFTNINYKTIVLNPYISSRLKFLFIVWDCGLYHKIKAMFK